MACREESTLLFDDYLLVLRHAPIIVSGDTCLVFLTGDPGAMN